jgi:hypothetical protein
VSQPLPAPGAGPIAGDDRPLNAREYQLLQRLLSDPFSLPMGFKTWLVGYLETSDVTLPMSAIMGLPTVAAAVNSGDSAWHVIGTPGEPPFQNGFAAWDARAPRFRKLASGMVVLSGVLRTPATGVTNVAFTMPSGYRPASPYDVTFWVNGTQQPTIFNLAPGGAANLSVPASPFNPVPPNSWCYIDGVQYFAEQ